MTFSVPFRDTSRTPLAFSLSVLLHGLVVAGLIAFLWGHALPPMPQIRSFELYAAPTADPNADDSPGPAAPSMLTAPQLPNISELPPAPPEVVPSPPQTVRPEPPTPPVPVSPARATNTPKPGPGVTTAKPQLPQRPATTQKPQTTSMDLQTWQKQHPATAPTNAGTANPAISRRGSVPNVSLNPNNYTTPLTRGGTGSGATRGRPNILASPGTDTDYLAYLRALLQGRFQAPGGVTGQYADVEITINADGAVEAKRITRSSGNPAFNAAVQAVMDSLTNVNPPPDGQRVTYPVRFQPEGV